MFERIFSNDSYPDNSAVLNRKIRTSNLITFSTVVILTSFSALFFYFMPFSEAKIVLDRGDFLTLFTDGFADQFG